MELKELTAYAMEKYRIQEQHKWADFPGFSVLSHPGSGKWVALLIRQWDSDAGTEIEWCDLKCGSSALAEFPRPYLSAPVRMHGKNWVGVSFGRETEPEVVFELFDRAFRSEEPKGFTITLEPLPVSGSACQDTPLPAGGIRRGAAASAGGIRRGAAASADRSVYRDTPLPAPGRGNPSREAIPDQLRQLRRFYGYGRETLQDKAENFYRQAMFMKDYEDNAPWPGGFSCYFPTYQDMTTKQLRGYFSWRTRIRRGEYGPISTSAAYIYVYELLNGIGADTPQESLDKLKVFEKGYIDAGYGDERMRKNLHKWMLEFAVVSDLPVCAAREFIDPEWIERDTALAALRYPGEKTDEEVFAALYLFSGRKLDESPVVRPGKQNESQATSDGSGYAARGRHLFCEAWRAGVAEYRLRDKSFFSLMFGEPGVRRWYPLSNTVYYRKEQSGDQDYVLNECRVFRCRNGNWTEESYSKLYFDRARLKSFLHEADLKLRRYLKTGHYLREKEEDLWASACIEAVIEADRRALIEAARPKITIDLSGLDQIRKDAQITRDSLLTGEELEELEQAESDLLAATEEPVKTAPGETLPEASFQPAATEELRSDLPLDDFQVRILQTLLSPGGGVEAADLIRSGHRMPAIVADAINEAMFDLIGDTVILCEDDVLSLVEDYREDVEQLVGSGR